MSDGANQEAPQASQLRLARRRPEFFGQAHERRDLVQLPCSLRSDVAHAALNSAAAQAPVAHELVKEQACFSDFLLAFFSGEEGKGLGGARKEAMRQGRGRARFLPRAPRGLRREAPTVPQRGTLRIFWPSCHGWHRHRYAPLPPTTLTALRAASQPPPRVTATRPIRGKLQ